MTGLFTVTTAIEKADSIFPRSDCEQVGVIQVAIRIGAAVHRGSRLWIRIGRIFRHDPGFHGKRWWRIGSVVVFASQSHLG